MQPWLLSTLTVASFLPDIGMPYSIVHNQSRNKTKDAKQKKKKKKQIFLQGKQHSQPNVPHGGRHMWATFTSPTLMALSVRNWARNLELWRTTNYGGRSRAFYLHANCIPALQCRLAFVCDSISTCAHRLGKRVLVSDLMQKSRHIYLHVRALLWTRSPFCSTHMYEGEKN